jgi:hypothetical protein
MLSLGLKPRRVNQYNFMLSSRMREVPQKDKKQTERRVKPFFYSKYDG